MASVEAEVADQVDQPVKQEELAEVAPTIAKHKWLNTGTKCQCSTDLCLYHAFQFILYLLSSHR